MSVWVISVLLLLTLPTLAVLPYMIYKVMQVGQAALHPDALKADTMLLFYSVLAILPTHLLTLGLAWLVVTEGGLRSFKKAIAWDWPEQASPSVTTLLSVLAAMGLFGLAWAFTTLWGGGKTDLDILIESSIYTRVATALVAFATAPLVEEVIYRGVIYPALEKAVGMGFAIAVVSLLFAGVHVYQYRNNVAVILVITLLSITLTVSRAISGKVLPAFIIHLIFNGVQSVLIVLSGFLDKELIK